MSRPHKRPRLNSRTDTTTPPDENANYASSAGPPSLNGASVRSKARSCLACRKLKHRCEFTFHQDRCHRCHSLGIPCVFEPQARRNLLAATGALRESAPSRPAPSTSTSPPNDIPYVHLSTFCSREFLTKAGLKVRIVLNGVWLPLSRSLRRTDEQMSYQH